MENKGLQMLQEKVTCGQWLRRDGEMYCSVCGGRALMDEVYYESPHCPECGIRMKSSNRDGNVFQKGEEKDAKTNNDT